MDVDRQKRLEEAGWIVGDASAFLELTAADTEHIERRLAQALTTDSMSTDSRNTPGSLSNA
jgi:hypothetical protein